MYVLNKNKILYFLYGHAISKEKKNGVPFATLCYKGDQRVISGDETMLPLNKNGKLMFFMAGAFLGAGSAHSVMMKAVDHRELARVHCSYEQPYGVQKAERAFSDGTRLLNLCNKFYSTVNREGPACRVGKEDCRLLCRLALGKVRRGLYLAQKAPRRELAAPLRECENALREYRMGFENWTSEDSKARKHLKTVDGHVRKVAEFRELLTRLNGGCYKESSFEVKKCSCELPYLEEEGKDMKQEEMLANIRMQCDLGDLLFTFVGGLQDGYLGPDAWSRSFSGIRDVINVLAECTDVKVLELIAEPFWEVISANNFKSFLHFYSSECCDKDIVNKFLLLGCRGLEELSELELASSLRECVNSGSIENVRWFEIWNVFRDCVLE